MSLTQLLLDSWIYAMEHPDAPLAVGAGLPRLADMERDSPEFDPSRLGYFYTDDQRDISLPPGKRRHFLLVRMYPGKRTIRWKPSPNRWMKFAPPRLRWRRICRNSTSLLPRPCWKRTEK